MNIEDQTKKEGFLFRDQKRKMVTGTFVSFKNVGRDTEVIKLVSQLQEQTGRDDGMFMVYYATRRIYTLELEFDWHPEAPSYYTALEKYWEAAQRGESEAELYLFYIENITNRVGTEWMAALDAAQKLWKPSEEGWDDEVDEEGRETDPN